MAKSNPLARFDRASSVAKPRIIGASVGEVGTRKSSFWLEGPGPIVVHSFDHGLEGVVEQFQEHKDIYVREYDWVPTEDLSQDDAITLRNEFIDDYEHSLAHARTVVLDKETDLWELFRYAEFGAANDAPRNYPQLNQRYRKYANMPKALDINVGFIQGMKDEWKPKVNAKTGAQGAAASGRRIRAGFGELDALVHVDLFHAREVDEDGQVRFRMHVGKSRGPGAKVVQEQDYYNLTFSDFGMLVFPETEETDWQ